jgi:hypothetical protein
MPIPTPQPHDALSDAPGRTPVGAPYGGHGPKIEEAIAALQAAGQLMAGLRSSERDKRIENWLRGCGYRGDELPSRWAIWRYFRATR